MSKDYEFFEHTADIGVHVYGADLPALFTNAAAAMYEALGEWTTGNEQLPRSITLPAGNLEDLLHDWLSELLFEFEAHGRLFRDFQFEELSPTGGRVHATGCSIDPARSSPHEEIKAVTYHQLSVQQLPDGTWRATVIFDV